jgi:Tol biopolymer transport system component
MIRAAYSSFGILCALMLLVAGPAAQRTDSAQARLRAAADAATVEGDLRKAIAQYQSIVDAYPADRPVVAMALVGMAEAYQKLGNAEAEKLYERLVRDYVDQAEAAAIARTRLGDRTAARPAAGDRAVLTGPNVNGFGTVTPDGRFMTYVDGETQQVTLRDLRNGTDRPLTSGTRAYIARDARTLTAISRDGRQVAFEWATPNSGEIELRLANLEGTGVPESRRLLAFKLDDALAISVFDWSPDGKWLVVSIQRTDLVGQLSLVSVQDGSYRVLKSIGWTGPHRAFFSPDGRSLAYSVPADDTLDESRVFVMAVDGSRERVVVDHPSRNIIMGWSPDGGSVLFSSNRGGSAGLWMVPVTDGQSVRTATLLKPNIGSSWSLGVTSSGALFTWKRTIARYLQVAPADVDLGTASTGPAGAFEIYLGPGGNPAWSPDGKYLAYMHGDLDENFSCCGTFTIRSTDGRVVRRLPQRLSYLQRFAWSLDGRALIGPGRDAKGRWGTYRVDVETGEPTRIGDGRLWWTSESPAHRTMVANTTLDGTKHFFSSYARSLETNVEVRVDARAAAQIIERDVSSGAERVIADRLVVPAPGGLAVELQSLFLSPDTRYLAFGQAVQSNKPPSSEPWSSRTPGTNALFIVPAAGGTPRELFRGVGRVVWTSDSRALLALKAPPDRQELWVVPIDGSAPRNLAIEVHDSSGQIPFSLRPDGRQIAFVAGNASPSWSEIWRIENFLPAPNTSR